MALDRRKRVLVDTPIGPQWQSSEIDTPNLPSHWSAGYAPAGRQAGVPASYRTQQKGNMFGDIYRNAIGNTGGEIGEDVPKGTATFAGSSPLQGQFAKPMQMAPWSQAQAPSGYGQVERFRPRKKLFEGYKPWSLMG